jgi:hypothetical protein
MFSRDRENGFVRTETCFAVDESGRGESSISNRIGARGVPATLRSGRIPGSDGSGSDPEIRSTGMRK